MNVLRIWGGGVYPEDHFFEQADRAGLLIWQDMMFSCKVYPLTMESFVQNSVIEIR
jgi:beta-mannosidase